jgi:hypothetical protein
MIYYPEKYDLVKVNGMIPDWMEDDKAFFGSPDDYFVISLDHTAVVQFFKLVEIKAD